MQSIDRLIAATDLSAPARHAAERAALVAHELGASLDLLHVISVSPVGRLRRLLSEAPADLEDALLGESRAELDRLAVHLRAGYGDAERQLLLNVLMTVPFGVLWPVVRRGNGNR